MLDMLNRQILPAAFNYEQQLAQICLKKKELKIDNSIEINTLKDVSNLVKIIDQAKNKLLRALADVRNIDN
jgi:glutamine synthetase type III